MLKVNKLAVSYGGIRAVRDVSFEVEQGEIVALIGSNGAGKSSTLQAISNIIKKNGGEVIFDGVDISDMPPETIVESGLIHVPEGRWVFADMSVRDNLDLGAYVREDWRGIQRDMERVYELFPRLRDRQKQLARFLSGGEQQMLAIGRAFMARPRLLCLDEPSMGLSPLLVGEIFDIIRQINQMGTTIVLVEQNAYKALALSSRAYVLETGMVVKSGLAADLLHDSAVKTAYLGS
jgi:branched-chain amino acid transport system ATP-binding protein